MSAFLLRGTAPNQTYTASRSPFLRFTIAGGQCEAQCHAARRRGEPTPGADLGGLAQSRSDVAGVQERSANAARQVARLRAHLCCHIACRTHAHRQDSAPAKADEDDVRTLRGARPSAAAPHVGAGTRGVANVPACIRKAARSAPKATSQLGSWRCTEQHG
jgi:hypothetical protein